MKTAVTLVDGNSAGIWSVATPAQFVIRLSAIEYRYGVSRRSVLWRVDVALHLLWRHRVAGGDVTPKKLWGDA